MSLYKAHRRLSDRRHAASSSDASRIPELLAAQRGRCPICREPLEPSAARLDAPSDAHRAALLHAACLELLRLARRVGPEVLDRAKERL